MVDIKESGANKQCLQVFRYWENNYSSSGRIVFSHEWRLMKSLSCHGECCEGTNRRCYSPFDDIDSAGMEGLAINLPKHPIHGRLYQAVFIPDTPDFETGYLEDWEWDMVPWDGKTNRKD